MKQVKVLLIAPYEGMKEVAESVAAGREDIDLTVLVGNMQKGLKLVRECDQSRYDVIISRGGTAEIIREAASIPLVEIELTPYDIHNALAEVSGTQKQYMVAGSPRIVDAAVTLCDLLNTQVKTVTIRNDAEGRALLPHGVSADHIGRERDRRRTEPGSRSFLRRWAGKTGRRNHEGRT